MCQEKHSVSYIDCPHVLKKSSKESKQSEFLKESKYDVSIIYLFNLFHSLGSVNRWQLGDIFLLFPRKQNLSFHANYLQQKSKSAKYQILTLYTCLR